MAAQARGAGGLDQRGTSVSGQKWSDLKSPLKMEPLEFTDRLDVGQGTKGGNQVGFKVLVRTTTREVLLLTKVDDTGEAAGWWRKQEFCYSEHIKPKLTNCIQLDMSSR